MEIDPAALATVAAAGFAAGFVDSVAGGGGLISLPALLAAGLPPHLALGTNKLQSAMGTSFAAANYARRGLAGREGLALGAACTGLAALAGAACVSRIAGGVLVRVIPWLLAAIFFHAAAKPRIGETPSRPRVGVTAFGAGAGLVLGFYDGFFGPGTGSFWTAGFVLLAGLALPQATGRTKVMNLASNLASLAWFSGHGDVAWALGASMGVANIGGALLGSHLAIRKGARFIRVFFLIAVGATIARLAWRSFGG
jgi:hypothetical protein